MSTLLNKILNSEPMKPLSKPSDPDRCNSCGHNHFKAVMSGWECEVCGVQVPFTNATSTAAIAGIEEEKEDTINPSHYTSGAIECIDAIKAAMTPEAFLGFLKGQVFKYNWRMGRKGDAAEDSRKAAWYQDRLTKELEAAQ